MALWCLLAGGLLPVAIVFIAITDPNLDVIIPAMCTSHRRAYASAPMALISMAWKLFRYLRSASSRRCCGGYPKHGWIWRLAAG